MLSSAISVMVVILCFRAPCLVSVRSVVVSRTYCDVDAETLATSRTRVEAASAGALGTVLQ